MVGKVDRMAAARPMVKAFPKAPSPAPRNEAIKRWALELELKILT